MGMGCWAIGGPWKFGDDHAGWGTVDDRESVRAISVALERGVNFFDTAANYGAGHSERVLGQAIKAVSSRVILATKFGYGVFEDQGRVFGVDATPAAIRRSLEDSLRRLDTDYLDLFHFHVGDYPLEEAGEVLHTLEALVSEGSIRAYGWSTDDPARAALFAEGEHCVSVQHQQNVLEDNAAMLELCAAVNLTSINRGPLAMGLLSGKYATGASFEGSDLRSSNREWMAYFKDGQVNPAWQGRLESIREVLTSSGRTLAQGALAWLWARSPHTLPIPGFRTVAQVEENVGALEFGPLDVAQMLEIEKLLER